MKNNNIIQRSFDLKVSNLRSVDDANRIIEGYAIVFNQRSCLLLDWSICKTVIEVISPDAVSDDLLRSSDVICNINHNNDQMLARSKQGKGSLTLEKDDSGLKFRFECPNTPDGQTAYEGVKRGDFSGCSFAYYNDDDEVNVSYSKETDDQGNDTIIRTVNKIDHLCDVSIVLNPAYQQTLVDARSAEKDKLEHAIKRAIPEYQTEPSNKRSEAMIRDYDELDKIFKF